jgi:type IV secretion system protein VirD4
MSATRILWGRILLLCAVYGLAVWTATQWVAWRLGFQ